MSKKCAKNPLEIYLFRLTCISVVFSTREQICWTELLGPLEKMIPSQWLTLFCVWSLRRRERFPLSEKYWDLRNFWWVGQSVGGCRNIRKEWSEGRRGSQGGFPGPMWAPKWLSAAPTAGDILVRMVFGHGFGSKTTGLKSKTHIWAIINCHGLPVKNWKGVDGTVARCLQLCEDLFFDLLTKHVCYCLFCK